MDKIKVVCIETRDTNMPEMKVNYTEELGANLPMKAPKPKRLGACLLIVCALGLVATCIHMWPNNKVIAEPVQEQTAVQSEQAEVQEHLIYSLDGEPIGTYIGEMVESRYPVGYGEVRLLDGPICTGIWDCGPKEGEIYKLTFNTGSRYEGTISEDYLPDGTGLFYSRDGETLTLKDVKWVEDKEYGNNRYTGMLNGNLLCGYGKADLADNKEYEGEFENNAYNGYGRYIEKEEDGTLLTEYVGYFADNKYHGVGQFTNFDKNGEKETIFQGDFYDGVRHGQGVQVWKKTGSTYEGSWENGRPAGHGTFISVERETSEGMWEWTTDKDVGIGTYTGMLLDGKLWGYGTLSQTVFADGENVNSKTWEGEFKGGQPHGWLMVTEDDKEPYAYRAENGDDAGQSKAEPCQVKLTLKLNGEHIAEGGIYEVRPGDKIEMIAEGTVAPIERIGYYSNLDTEICDTYSDVVSYELSEYESGKRLHFYVEAIGENDDGTPNTVTKTGWRHYIFQY